MRLANIQSTCHPTEPGLEPCTSALIIDVESTVRAFGIGKLMWVQWLSRAHERMARIGAVA